MKINGVYKLFGDPSIGNPSDNILNITSRVTSIGQDIVNSSGLTYNFELKLDNIVDIRNPEISEAVNHRDNIFEAIKRTVNDVPYGNKILTCVDVPGYPVLMHGKIGIQEENETESLLTTCMINYNDRLDCIRHIEANNIGVILVIIPGRTQVIESVYGPRNLMDTLLSPYTNNTRPMPCVMTPTLVIQGFTHIWQFNEYEGNVSQILRCFPLYTFSETEDVNPDDLDLDDLEVDNGIPLAREPVIYEEVEKEVAPKPSFSESIPVLDMKTLEDFKKEYQVSGPEKEKKAFIQISNSNRTSHEKINAFAWYYSEERIKDRIKTLFKFQLANEDSNKAKVNVVNFLDKEYKDEIKTTKKDKMSLKVKVPRDVEKVLKSLFKNKKRSKKSEHEDMHSYSRKLLGPNVPSYKELVDYLMSDITKPNADRIKDIGNLIIDSLYEIITTQTLFCNWSRDTSARLVKSMFNRESLVVADNGRMPEILKFWIDKLELIKTDDGIRLAPIKAIRTDDDSRTISVKGYSKKWITETATMIVNTLLEHKYSYNSDTLIKEMMIDMIKSDNGGYNVSSPHYARLSQRLCAAISPVVNANINGLPVKEMSVQCSKHANQFLDKPSDWIESLKDMENCCANFISDKFKQTLNGDASGADAVFSEKDKIYNIDIEYEFDIMISSAISLAGRIMEEIHLAANPMRQLLWDKIIGASLPVYHERNHMDNPKVIYGLTPSSPSIMYSMKRYSKPILSSISLRPIAEYVTRNASSYYSSRAQSLLIFDDIIDNTRKNIFEFMRITNRPNDGTLEKLLKPIPVGKTLIFMADGSSVVGWPFGEIVTNDIKLLLERRYRSNLNMLKPFSYLILDRPPLTDEEINLDSPRSTSICYDKPKKNPDRISRPYSRTPFRNVIEGPEEGNEYLIDIPAPEANEFNNQLFESFCGRRHSPKSSIFNDSMFHHRMTTSTQWDCQDTEVNDNLIVLNSIIDSYRGGLTRNSTGITTFYSAVRNTNRIDLPLISSIEHRKSTGNINCLMATSGSFSKTLNKVIEKNPDFVFSATYSGQRSYSIFTSSVDGVKMRSSLRSALNNELTEDAPVNWTDIEALKAIKGGEKSQDTMFMLASSPDIESEICFRFGWAIPTKKAFLMLVTSSMATMIKGSKLRLEEAAALEKKEAEKDINPYIPTEITKLLKLLKGGLLENQINNSKESLRVHREKYSELFFKEVPRIREMAKELRKLKSADSMLSDEKLIQKVVTSGHIQGARVVGKDIFIKLPTAYIWHQNRIYDIGTVILVIQNFGTYKGSIKFYNMEPLDQRYKGHNLPSSLSGDGNSYDAPHVRSGDACLGNAEGMIMKSIKSGDLSGVIGLCKQYINTVNHTDMYGKSIYMWPWIPATLNNVIKTGNFGSFGLPERHLVASTEVDMIKTSSMSRQLLRLLYTADNKRIDDLNNFERDMPHSDWNTLHCHNPNVTISKDLAKDAVFAAHPNLIKESYDSLRFFLDEKNDTNMTTIYTPRPGTVVPDWCSNAEEARKVEEALSKAHGKQEDEESTVGVANGSGAYTGFIPVDTVLNRIYLVADARADDDDEEMLIT